jgi:GNAT superfamily N-acetyltransferase
MKPKFYSTKLRLKPASPRDSADLLKFIRAYYKYEDIPFDRKGITAGLAFLLKSPSTGGAWLIMKCGKPVGYLILTFAFDLEFGGRQAILNDLYIEAPHRRIGLGTLALAQIEDFCRSSGVRAIELHVTIKNASVLEFYRGAGFKEYNRIPMSKCLVKRERD